MILPESATAAPAAVLLSFDDVFASVHTNALPILQAAGFPATAYVAVDKIGATGYATAEQIAALYAAGWDIGNHCTSHTDLSTLSAAEQSAEIAGCAAYLEANGMPRAARHLAYPFGGYNLDTFAALDENGIFSARTTSSAKMAIPDVPWKATHGAVSAFSALSLDAAKAYIDNAKPGEVLQFFFHEIDTAGPVGWATADFQALVDYIAGKGIVPITITEFYAAYRRGWVL